MKKTKSNNFLIYLLLAIVAIIGYTMIKNNATNNIPQTEIEQKHYEFSGKGKDVKTVYLNRGLAIFTFRVENNFMGATGNIGGNIALRLRNSDGSYYSNGMLFNEVQPSLNEKASLHIDESGNYLLIVETESRSKWTVLIN